MCVSSSSTSCRDVLQHEDLDGKIKTACLGSLLPQEQLERLENQYLDHKEVGTSPTLSFSEKRSLETEEEPSRLHQDKVKLWLSAALKKEEESWQGGGTPELLDNYRFTPLAIDVIQVRGLVRSPALRQLCDPPAQADGSSAVAASS